MDGVPVSIVLVDNGAAVNILPIASMKKLGKGDEELIPTEMTISNFTGGKTNTSGVLPLELTVGKRTAAFLW